MLSGSQIPCAPQPVPVVTTFDALGDLPRLTGHLLGHKPVDQRLPLRRKPSPWVAALRMWPGRPAPPTVGGNWYRWTPRDFGIFARMAHGDRYPSALAVAQSLFQEHLSALRLAGR